MTLGYVTTDTTSGAKYDNNNNNNNNDNNDNNNNNNNDNRPLFTHCKKKIQSLQLYRVLHYNLRNPESIVLI